MRSYKRLVVNRDRANRALTLVPPSYIVSLVSVFDSFYAGLIRCIYNLEPKLLYDSEKTFKFRDIEDYGSISEIKKGIISSKIESLLRDSHVAQVGWLEKTLNISTLRKFDGWADFVELTERRNLIVHSEGIVSGQYISECSNAGYDVSKISEGERLSVDRSYFDMGFLLIYKMGVMLTQMVAHTKYLEKYPEDLRSVDGILIENIFNLISDELYVTAIELSDFALGKHFEHSDIDRCYFKLNRAQAFKWSGQIEKCTKILKGIDCSAWRDDLIIPKLALEEKYDEMSTKMVALGNKSEIMTANAYREWPIFKEARGQNCFVNAFKEVFGEDLLTANATNIENAVANEAATTSTITTA